MLPNPKHKTFPEALRNARKAAGMTQAELSIAADISNVMAGRYERGMHSPEMSTWAKLNKALFPQVNESELEAIIQDDFTEIALGEASVEEIIEELKKRGFAKVTLASE